MTPIPNTTVGTDAKIVFHIQNGPSDESPASRLRVALFRVPAVRVFTEAHLQALSPAQQAWAKEVVQTLESPGGSGSGGSGSETALSLPAVARATVLSYLFDCEAPRSEWEAVPGRSSVDSLKGFHAEFAPERALLPSSHYVVAVTLGQLPPLGRAASSLSAAASSAAETKSDAKAAAAAAAPAAASASTAAAASATQDSKTWSCSACTFSNKKGDKVLLHRHSFRFGCS